MLYLIGGVKLATALALGTAGVGIFKLLDHDLGRAVEGVILRLHLDPENRLIHALIEQLGGISRSQLKAIGVGTFFYAALELGEGLGLLLQKRWAEYLTVLATLLLLPPELVELMRKPDALRFAVLGANLGVAFYLIQRLRQPASIPPEREPTPLPQAGASTKGPGKSLPPG